MANSKKIRMQRTYQNPVWPGYFADPFVLTWNGAYYAYGTNPLKDNTHDDKLFEVLYSEDFVQWHYLGGALERPQQPVDGAPLRAFWAPEVAEHNGAFYMYYSAASSNGDETHRLRVAVSHHPAGPFRDTGRLLLPDEDFTIDAHPFRDPKDGQWYLFFAKDFFDERVGTGTAVARLADDMVSIAGPVMTAIRASSDWQIFARNRSIYGRVWDAWHTIEGPAVVAYDGRYYCFYSGGAWDTAQYGVSYGVADNVLGPYRDEWSQHGPSVLQGIPDQVLGPGHNSVVLGPDNQTMFMVYHAWDVEQTARRMCIDPLVWTAQGPRCLGPSTTPQTIDVWYHERSR
jgi:GH43 family beta-xylosidase